MPRLISLSRSAKWLICAAVVAGAAVVALQHFHLVAYLHLPAFDTVWIQQTVRSLGVFGPIALIVIMVLAVVMSPIPSGPIAIAAGALYGVTVGAIVSGIGAEIGALIAFGLARYFGFDAVRRSQQPILKFIAVPRSQMALMAIVFASRLIPFISFDAISYAAGLTNLSMARFAFATALGIVPICWGLAAMGAGISADHSGWVVVVILGGVVTLVPLALSLLRAKR